MAFSDMKLMKHTVWTGILLGFRMERCGGDSLPGKDASEEDRRASYLRVEAAQIEHVVSVLLTLLREKWFC